jgi:hypothetical protein
VWFGCSLRDRLPSFTFSKTSSITGLERTGYLVTNMDTAIQSAKANEADFTPRAFAR